MDHSSQAVCPRACCSAAEKPPRRSPFAAAEYPLLTAATRESLSTAVKTEQPRIRKGNSGKGTSHPETAVDAHLLVTAVSQQGHQDAEAPEVDDLLAELVADSQAGEGAAELAQDAGIVGEHCRGAEGTRGEERRTSPGSEPALRVGIPNPAPAGQPGRSAWLGGCLPVGVEG